MKTSPCLIRMAEGLGGCQGPKPVCATMLMELLGHSRVSSMKLPLFKAVEGASTQCIPGSGHGPSPGGRYAFNMYILKVLVMQNLMAEHPLVNTAATWEPESRKQIP